MLEVIIIRFITDLELVTNIHVTVKNNFDVVSVTQLDYILILYYVRYIASILR